MKVCLISNQIAEWGKIGGFGTATRALGSALVRRGIEVTAVVVRRSSCGQQRVENLDGITVHGLGNLETLTSGQIYREIDADIYQSEEPTIATWHAQRTVPHRQHVVTCRDPRGWREHLVELRHTNAKRRLQFPAQWYYEASPLVKKAVRAADAVMMPAPTVLRRRINNLYGSAVKPKFVPYPVEMPESDLRKSRHPTILFVGRFDRRKRIERFFQLASRFPDCRFIAIGEAHDKRYDTHLRSKYGDLPNLNLPGFVPRFGKHTVADYYKDAWILVNTSAREGLPYTFLEAMSHGLAILSALDPEQFASHFGYFAERDDFEEGLAYLLENDRWIDKGQQASRLVAAIWNETNSVEQHLQVYDRLMAGASNSTGEPRH